MIVRKINIIGATRHQVQLSDFKAKIRQIRLSLGLCPRPRWESSQRSPKPLAGFKGSYTSKGEGKGKEEGRAGEGNERGKIGGGEAWKGRRGSSDVFGFGNLTLADDRSNNCLYLPNVPLHYISGLANYENSYVLLN